MKRPKFSIGFAMLVIAVIAVGLALLSRPTPLGGAISFSFAALSFLLATVATIYLRGNSQAYWRGFAIGGWTYLALPTLAFFVARDMGEGYELFLPNAALDAAFPYIAGDGVPEEPRSPPASGANQEESSFAKRWLEVDRNRPGFPPRNYLLIGHGLFALLTATGTACFVRLLHARREREKNPSEPEARAPNA